MKFSIITVTKNNKAGLLRAIECVRNQSYKNAEHIIVDGGSDDGSYEAIKNEQLKIKNLSLLTTHYSLLAISEADSGIYDAINKGIKLATGDVIGLLHSDDLYADEKVLERYAEVFNSDSGQVRRDFVQPGRAGMTEQVEAVYSDLVYVRQKSDSSPDFTSLRRGKQVRQDFVQPGRAGMTDRSTTNLPTGQAGYSLLTTSYSTIRYWKTHKQEFTTEAQRHRALKNGWMPPHPTLFIRKEIFEKFGFYNTDLKIASDYEMILRLLYKYKITSCYLPLTTYLMSIGGASNKSIGNIITKSREDYTAMKRNGIPFPLFTLLCKNFRKLPQFLARDLS